MIIETKHAQAGEHNQTEATVEHKMELVTTFQTITFINSSVCLNILVYQVCAKLIPSTAATGLAYAPHCPE